MGLDRPVVGGYSDGGQVALELGARHPEAASALIVGAAYPEFVDSGLVEVFRPILGADEAGRPDLAQVDAVLEDAADLVKSWHPGGERQWRTLVEQTAPMWLDYPGLTEEQVRAIDLPVLVFTGDRDGMIELDLIVSSIARCHTLSLRWRRTPITSARSGLSAPDCSPGGPRLRCTSQRRAKARLASAAVSTPTRSRLISGH